jgi:hypothetical protein
MFCCCCVASTSSSTEAIRTTKFDNNLNIVASRHVMHPAARCKLPVSTKSFTFLRFACDFIPVRYGVLVSQRKLDGCLPLSHFSPHFLPSPFLSFLPLLPTYGTVHTSHTTSHTTVENKTPRKTTVHTALFMPVLPFPALLATHGTAYPTMLPPSDCTKAHLTRHRIKALVQHCTHRAPLPSPTPS